MYLPKQFEETRTDVLHRFMRERSFAALVVATEEGLNVDHLPFLLDEVPGPFGVLRGHVSRSNPILKATRVDMDAVAIFQGPDHYITPSWYATKKETGKVVPTWNYVVVHAHGRPNFIDDETWLRGHVQQLTHRHEGTRDVPWKVSDAPEDYVAKLVGGIVGVEMPIARLVGKWKLGQNRPEADQRGMIDGLLLEKEGTALAALIEAAGGNK
jgi:transcriptional regulator